LVRAPPW